LIRSFKRAAEIVARFSLYGGAVAGGDFERAGGVLNSPL